MPPPEHTPESVWNHMGLSERAYVLGDVGPTWTLVQLKQYALYDDPLDLPESAQVRLQEIAVLMNMDAHDGS